MFQEVSGGPKEKGFFNLGSSERHKLPVWQEAKAAAQRGETGTEPKDGSENSNSTDSAKLA